MLDDQPRINQQDNGVIQRSPADPELFLFRHIGIQRVNVEMPLDGINSFKYSIAFRRLTMPVLLQIICQNLLYFIFYLFFHRFITFRVQSYSFLCKQKSSRH